MRKSINIFCLLLLSFTISTTLYGQQFHSGNIEKLLPAITSWIDNNHIILSNPPSDGVRQHYTKYNVVTGVTTPHEMGGVSDPKPHIRSIGGEILYFDGKSIINLTKSAEKEINPMLSPDGERVAFTRNNDLYSINTTTGKETRYTYDGSDVILNGYASWVYYEEIFGRESKYRAFWWSPDSKHLFFYRFDDSEVPMFPIYNSSGQHGYIEQTRYPKAGDTNPQVKIGIIQVDDSKIVWADFDPTEDQYFGTPFWKPDGSGVLVQWMPRRQNNLKLYDVNPTDGKKTEIYSEVQQTWVDWIDPLIWHGDGFLMVRDYDGWQQIYYHTMDGRLKQKLTEGQNWKTSIVKIDDRQGVVFYTSNKESSTRSDLYCVRLNGKEQKRLTFGEYSHDKISISPDGQYFTTVYANCNTPPALAVVKVKGLKRDVLADSRGSDFDKASLNFPEMVWLTTKDGHKLPGRVTWPAERESGVKYPVVIQVYGGPNAGTVYERWIPAKFMMPNREEEPVVRIAIDHRGSGHCGKRGMDYLYGKLGKWEMNDYIEWVEWLRDVPCVDSERIMITGGSYGGYITALALTYGSEYFQYGIADYPVVDWLLYDSHYTERYMGLPSDNPEGYRLSSVLTYADRYQTNGDAMLLIQHGTMDDNVHMQNSIQLVDQLQNHNKSFEFMLYPNERHGWFGVKLPFTSNIRKSFINRHLHNKAN